MRTIKVVFIVVAFGTAALIWGMAGAGALYGADDPVDGLQSGEELSEQANNSSAAEGGSFNTSAQTSGDDGLLGVVFSAGETVINFATMAALLPSELQALGFPAYFAQPIGRLAQLIAGIGVVQFLAGRVYR